MQAWKKVNLTGREFGTNDTISRNIVASTTTYITAYKDLEEVISATYRIVIRTIASLSNSTDLIFRSLHFYTDGSSAGIFAFVDCSREQWFVLAHVLREHYILPSKANMYYY
jgi:hypothetical protein